MNDLNRITKIKCPPDFTWRKKNLYTWNIYENSVSIKNIVFIGTPKDSQKNKKDKDQIIVKKIEEISKNSKRALFLLRELTYLTLLKKSEYFVNLKEIVGPEKKDFDNIYLLFPRYGNDLVRPMLTENFDYNIQQNLIQYILLQITCGLNYLHSLGIIHQDIKPDNILIDGEGGIKICDLGSAIEKKNLKYSKDKIGTLQYMAPEYLISEKKDCGEYDEKIDMWGLGVIMVELYRNKPQFFTDYEHKFIYDGKDIDGSIIGGEKKWMVQIKYIFKRLGIKVPNENNFNNNSFDGNNVFCEGDIDEFFKNREKLKNFIKSYKMDKNVFDNIFKTLIKDDTALDLLSKLLNINPQERISAKDALKSEYFKNVIDYVDITSSKKEFYSPFDKVYSELANDLEKRNNYLKNEITKIYKQFHHIE